MKGAAVVLFVAIGGLSPALSTAQTSSGTRDWAASFSVAAVEPADALTSTAIGGELEVDRFVSPFVSVGVVAGLCARF